MASSYRFIVTGRVQGVFFRQSTQQTAQRLGLQGWVRNDLDGSVEGLVAGEAEALEAFRIWLAEGPPRARVDSVQWQPGIQAVDSAGFEVRS
ncbi:acylphosphatase [Algiphilus sp. W345]|uniref:Acylphosphatase n=1 Tax=Banduia mediterranea TaxID=3075609 RepID=A0ABU2WJ38_9GAMM|nr:acylphosphatase [Algiphilus sp. W345]MDT0497857.1 acylphosphatase [Algiphilus sp. W345]